MKFKNIVYNSYPILKKTINTLNISNQNYILYPMILGKYLEKKGYPIDYYHYYEEMYGYNNHIHIKYRDLIIEPIWKKSFIFDFSENTYNNYLYNTLPYMFVGNNIMLRNLYNHLNEKHIEQYGFILDRSSLNKWEYCKRIDNLKEFHREYNDKIDMVI